jgi:hypothetical protein
MGLGLCRAVPAVTPHLPCRAGRGSPLAGIAGGNVSPAAERRCGGLPYWLTGIKGCDRRVYPIVEIESKGADWFWLITRPSMLWS